MYMISFFPVISHFEAATGLFWYALPRLPFTSAFQQWAWH